MSKFYPNNTHSAAKTYSTDDATSVTDAQVEAYLAAREEKAKAAKEAARKAKATEVGTKIGTGIASTGKVTGNAVKTTAVVGAKVGKTLWNGSFNLLKAGITAVQDAPVTAAKAVTTASHVVAAEYHKS